MKVVEGHGNEMAMDEVTGCGVAFKDAVFSQR